MADCKCFDWFRVAVLVLGYGYVARQDRKTWMWAESVMWAVYSAALFICPDVLFPGSDSPSLFFVIRIFAALSLATHYGIFVCRASRDEGVVGAILWARMLCTSMLVFVMGYAYSQKSELFPDKTLYFDMCVFALSALAAAYRMWVGQYRVGGREQKDHVSTIYRVFFLIAFLSGVCFLAFPSWMLYKKPDALETVVLRCVGACVFSSSILWWYATSFREDSDRSTVFKCYLLGCALVFVAMCLGYFRDGAFGRQEFLNMHCCFVTVLLAALGQYLLWKSNYESNTSSYYLRSKSQ